MDLLQLWTLLIKTMSGQVRGEALDDSWLSTVTHCTQMNLFDVK